MISLIVDNAHAETFAIANRFTTPLSYFTSVSTMARAKQGAAPPGKRNGIIRCNILILVCLSTCMASVSVVFKK